MGFFSRLRISDKNESTVINNKAKEKIKLNGIAITAKDFYTICVENGIEDVESLLGQARLELFSKNNNIQLNIEEVKQYFIDGENEVEQSEEQVKLNEMLLLVEQERVYEELSKKYITLYGQEKAVKMCLDEAKIYHKIVADCDALEKKAWNNSNEAYMAYAQKESSWAIHGGLASGLAGGAIGVATAMYIQDKNRTIQSSNKKLEDALLNKAVDVVLEISKKRQAAKDKEEFWENEASEMKKHLVQDVSEHELLSRIGPKVIKQRQSETGAIEISVQTNSTQNLYIFENIKAVVDGCFKAVIWDDQIRVGEAFFALPYEGAKEKYELSSICCSSKLEIGKNYNITFEPEKLWGLEIRKNISKEEKKADELKPLILEALKSRNMRKREIELMLWECNLNKASLADLREPVSIVLEELQKQGEISRNNAYYTYNKK